MFDIFFPYYAHPEYQRKLFLFNRPTDPSYSYNLPVIKLEPPYVSFELMLYHYYLIASKLYRLILKTYVILILLTPDVH